MSRNHAFPDGRCTLVSCRRLNWHGWQVVGQRRRWSFNLRRPLYSQDRSLVRSSLLNDHFSQFGRQDATLKRLWRRAKCLFSSGQLSSINEILMV